MAHMCSILFGDTMVPNIELLLGHSISCIRNIILLPLNPKP